MVKWVRFIDTVKPVDLKKIHHTFNIKKLNLKDTNNFINKWLRFKIEKDLVLKKIKTSYKVDWVHLLFYRTT